jgi:hypothetical protein
MFKKLGTLALTAALALLGMNAPANAAGSLDPVDGSIANPSVSFVVPLTSTFTTAAGATSLQISKYWNLTTADVQALGGKTVSVHVSVTAPDGTVMTINGPMTSGSGLSASYNPSFSFGGGNNHLNSNYGDTSYTLPADTSTFTYGSVSTSLYINNYTVSGMRSVQNTIPAGTWTVSAKVAVDGVDHAETTTFGGSYAVDPSQSNANIYFGNSMSGTAPAAATSASVNVAVCADSSLISAGDVLTLYKTVGGVTDNANAWFSWRSIPMGASRSNNSGTVVADDITNRLVANANFQSNVTGGSAFTASVQLLNQNNVNVTGTCKPNAPAKPTLLYSNGSYTVGFTGVAGASSYGYDCYLYDVTAPSTVVAQGFSMGSVYPGSAGTCSLSSGTLAGHSYVAKVDANWNGYVSDQSPASDAVLKPTPGYTFTTPVSGVTNVGNKLSRVTSAITQDSDSTRSSAQSDGSNGLLVTERIMVSSGPYTFLQRYVVRHVTKTGADGSFAGTGTAAVSLPDMVNSTNVTTGWYGANHDKWATVYGQLNMADNSSGVTVVAGSFTAATTSTVTVPKAKLDAICVSAYGAGEVSVNPNLVPMQAAPTISMISANTANPTFMLSCWTSNMGMAISQPVLINIVDANTVNLITALITLGANVNTGSAFFSANPNAGANDAALTFVVSQGKNTGGPTVIDSRVIKTMTPGGTVATGSATYTVSGTEPALTLANLNDGTVWGTLNGPSGLQLLKISSGGNAVTQTNVTFDTNASFATSSMALPVALQSGSASTLTVVRSTATPGNFARASIDTATGNVTTSGEVAVTTLVSNTSVVSSLFLNTSNNNLYWLVNEVSNPGKYSLYKWLDPNFHLTAQTIAWANNTPTTLSAGGTATVAATATSSLAVTYGTTDGSICTVNASTGVVTAVASTGNCVVTADQAGDGTYDSAPQVTTTLAIQKRSQTISWTTSPASVTVGSTATVAASATSGLAVTYGTSDSTVCTVTSAGVVTPVASTGNCVVTANQAGNGTYNAATQVTLTIAITAHALTAQTISWTTSPATVTVGSTATVAATATSGLAVTYGTTDSTVCTVTSAGVVTPVASTGNCVVTANQAGNGTYSAAAQKTLTIAITAAAPAKTNPTLPTVGTSVKKGKTLAIALAATGGTATKGANVNGLATTVTAGKTAKGICTVTAVKKAGKITGYTVKGLAVNATKCAVTVAITGNNLYNALTQTFVIKVTK